MQAMAQQFLEEMVVTVPFPSDINRRNEQVRSLKRFQ
jgi:hypothetical protein